MADGSGDRRGSSLCRGLVLMSDGVEDRDELYTCGALPLYLVISVVPPVTLRLSRKKVASSTNVCGPCGGDGGGYFRSSIRANEYVESNTIIDLVAIERGVT